MRKYRIAASITALVVAGSLAGVAVADSTSAGTTASTEGAQAVAAAGSESAASASTVTREAQTLDMEKLGNARQLGGYVGAEGKTVKEGLLLRTAKLSDATEADLAKLVDEYNLGYICDFRTSAERASDPDPVIEGVQYVWCSLVDEESDTGVVATDWGEGDTSSLLANPVEFESGEVVADGEAAEPEQATETEGQNAGAQQAAEEQAAEGQAAEEQVTEEQDAEAQQKAALSATVKTLVEYSEAFDLPTMYDGTVDGEQAHKGFHAFFDVLLNNKDGKAVLWHSTAGKDRAGLCAALLLSALGVDRATILDDFALTNDFNAVKIEALVAAAEADGYTAEQAQAVRDLTGVNRDYLEHTLDYIDQTYGSMHDYLINQIGLTEDEIAQLQEMYLEG